MANIDISNVKSKLSRADNEILKSIKAGNVQKRQAITSLRGILRVSSRNLRDTMSNLNNLDIVDLHNHATRLANQAERSKQLLNEIAKFDPNNESVPILQQIVKILNKEYNFVGRRLKGSIEDYNNANRDIKDLSDQVSKSRPDILNRRVGFKSNNPNVSINRVGNLVVNRASQTQPSTIPTRDTTSAVRNTKSVNYNTSQTQIRNENEQKEWEKKFWTEFKSDQGRNFEEVLKAIKNIKSINGGNSWNLPDIDFKKSGKGNAAGKSKFGKVGGIAKGALAVGGLGALFSALAPSSAQASTVDSKSSNSEQEDIDLDIKESRINLDKDTTENFLSKFLKYFGLGGSANSSSGGSSVNLAPGSGGFSGGRNASTAILGSRGYNSNGGGFTPAGTVKKQVTTGAFNSSPNMALPSDVSGTGTSGGGITNSYGFSQSSGKGSMGSMAQLPGQVTGEYLSTSGNSAMNIGKGGQYRPVYNLTDRDLSDDVIKTIAGEARIKDPKSVDAVINTMFNRLGSKGYGPSSNLGEVASAPGQFAGYNKGQVSPQQAEMIRSRIKEVATGKVEDNTGGANEFRTEGYSGPWGQKHALDSKSIGGNTFAKNSNSLGTYHSYDKPLLADSSNIEGTTPNVLEKQSGIRKLPISSNLKDQLQFAAEKAGVQVEIGSGGQESSGPNRTGSHRHDFGQAADLKLYKTDENGNRRVLDMNNPNDAVVMKQFAKESVRAGATGIGAANDYMGPNTMHIGGGTPAVWGKSNGPAPFIAEAHREGMKDQESGKIELETWKAARAAKEAAKSATDANREVKESITVESKPSSIFTGQIAPKDLKSRTLGAMVKAYRDGENNGVVKPPEVNSPSTTIEPKNDSSGNNRVPYTPPEEETKSSNNSNGSSSTSGNSNSTTSNESKSDNTSSNNVNTKPQANITTSDIPTRHSGAGLEVLNHPNLTA